MAVVETPLYLFKVQVEEAFVNASILMEPVFGIRPEAFHPIEVIFSFSYALLFRHYHAVAADRKQSVGYSIIGVIQAPWSGVLGNKRQ